MLSLTVLFVKFPLSPSVYKYISSLAASTSSLLLSASHSCLHTLIPGIAYLGTQSG